MTAGASSTTPTCASSPGRPCAGPVRRAGFDILEEVATGLPLGAIADRRTRPRLVRLVRRIDGALVRLRPTLFGYQHILRLTPHAEQAIHAVQNPVESTGSAGLDARADQDDISA